MRIYIAGPYTKGDVEANVVKAIELADFLTMLGHCPYVPHLNHYWEQRHHHQHGFWVRLCLDELRNGNFDLMMRIAGESEGADLEEEEARKLGIRVYYLDW